MKKIILSLMMMVSVGCGEKETTTKPVTKTALKTVTEKAKASEKATTFKKASDEAQTKTSTNSLGMKFVPAYAVADDGVVDRLKNPFGDRFKQTDTHPVVMVSWKDAQVF